MKAMVVYDSVHGNTEQVAHMIARTLGPAEEVETRQVSETGAGLLMGLDILVVGAPTHAFRPTPTTKEFLKKIPSGGLLGVRVAAFDTRISVEDTDSAILPFMVKLFGYAANPIGKALTKRGGELVAEPEGFYVEGKEGPLKEGELERAEAWARRIREAVA